MKSLLIVGAGSFSLEVEELAKCQGFTDCVFIDDNPQKACCRPVIGTTADISSLRTYYDTAIVALGDNADREKFYLSLKDNKYTIPTLIHPTAFISPDAKLNAGCIIRAHAVVSRYVKLGEAVIVNVGALIDHQCEVGSFSHILMGAVVRNRTKIEPHTWVKANEVVE